jgi:DNA-binding MarR family transcriptional regulator
MICSYCWARTNRPREAKNCALTINEPVQAARSDQPHVQRLRPRAQLVHDEPARAVSPTPSGGALASRRPLAAVEQAERARMAASETSWALRDVNCDAAEMDQVLAGRLGMRPLDYAAMSHVLTADGGIGPHELSARLRISSGSATEPVDRLERSEHLRRERDGRDRRRVALQATDTAVQQILGELGPLFTALDDLDDEFTDQELDAVVRYLRLAARSMRSYNAGHQQT